MRMHGQPDQSGREALVGGPVAPAAPKGEPAPRSSAKTPSLAAPRPIPRSATSTTSSRAPGTTRSTAPAPGLWLRTTTPCCWWATRQRAATGSHATRGAQNGTATAPSRWVGGRRVGGAGPATVRAARRPPAGAVECGLVLAANVATTPSHTTFAVWHLAYFLLVKSPTWEISSLHCTKAWSRQSFAACLSNTHLCVPQKVQAAPLASPRTALPALTSLESRMRAAASGRRRACSRVRPARAPRARPRAPRGCRSRCTSSPLAAAPWGAAARRRAAALVG